MIKKSKSIKYFIIALAAFILSLWAMWTNKGTDISITLIVILFTSLSFGFKKMMDEDDTEYY